MFYYKGFTKVILKILWKFVVKYKVNILFFKNISKTQYFIKTKKLILEII